MGRGTSDPVGLIVVRVREEGGRLLARVTTTPNVDGTVGESVRYCSTADQVCTVVTEFFADFPPQ